MMRQVVGVVLGLALGCGGSDGGAGAPDAPPPPGTVVQTLPPFALDVLFVIDNSGDMAEEQALAVEGFGAFLAPMEALPGGLPSLHVGVVSSNAGAGGQPADRCEGDGDDGRLQDTPRIKGCAAPTGRFMSIERDEAGIEVRNFDGSPAATFACIGTLGSGGCGFEQHLESMRRALDGHDAENAGFLRDDAWLAVVLLATEDDCSARDPAIFDPADMTAADPLGPATSYRCFEFGVICDGARPGRGGDVFDPLGGPRECEAGGARTPFDADYLWHPQVYVDFLKGLKRDAGTILVAGMFGDVEPVTTSLTSEKNPRLDASCNLSELLGVSAVPGVRLAAFLDGFPGRSSAHSICQDLTGPLADAGAMIAGAIATPCLTGDVDTDGCTARDATGAEVAFSLVATPERCGAYPTGLAVELAEPEATAVTVSCPGR